MSFNSVDIAFAVITAVILVYSYFTGFIKRMSGAFSLAGAVVAAYFAYKPVCVYLKFTKTLNMALVFFALFIVFFIVIRIILHKVSDSVSDTAVIGTANRLLGLAVGILQCAGIILISSLVIFLISEEFALQSKVIEFLAKLFNLI